MSWSPQQEQAAKQVRTWLRQPRSYSPQVFRLFGFAGTGKTTLAKHLAETVKGNVLFGAYTGKAALVLRRKGCGDASTIHSMIYRVDEEDEGQSGSPAFTLNPFSAVLKAGLVVIDECSMVDEALGRDLLSFGTPVLVLGDPAQLPPVRGTGFFTDATPDVMLTEVHRQAAENPIIRMSMAVREGGRLDHGRYGESRVITRADVEPEDVLGTDQVLVGKNATRRAFNARIRCLKGLDASGPQEGDRLVCLKNDRRKKLLNGGLWTVDGVKGVRRTTGLAVDGNAPAPAAPTGEKVKMTVACEDDPGVKPRSVSVLRAFFDGSDEAAIPRERRSGTDEFTYGYALTTHKAQGSQWDDVVLFDESSSFHENRSRWLYTAVTRAAERITVVR